MISSDTLPHFFHKIIQILLHLRYLCLLPCHFWLLWIFYSRSFISREYSFSFFSVCVLFPFRWKLHPWDQLFFTERLFNGIVNKIIDFLLIAETDFHLSRMDIHIQIASIHCKMEHRKRIFMLHRKSFIGIFDRFCNNAALHIPSIDIIIFIISVSSGNQGLSDITADLDAFRFPVNFQKISGDISAINMVDHIFQPSISGCMDLWLSVCEKLKGNLRM